MQSTLRGRFVHSEQMAAADAHKSVVSRLGLFTSGAIVSISFILFFELVVEQQLLQPGATSSPEMQEALARLDGASTALTRLDGKIAATDARVGAAQAQLQERLGRIESEMVALRAATALQEPKRVKPPQTLDRSTASAAAGEDCKPPPVRPATALSQPRVSPHVGVTGSSRFTDCPDGAELEALSYDAAWKDGRSAFPVIPTVMETSAGTCNVFSTKAFCCDFQAGHGEHVPKDSPIVSTILAFLTSCVTKTATSCVAVDIGANMGTMTKYALSTGARVIAVEPQTDLATLAWYTACRNNWDKQLTMYNNAVTAEPSEAGSTITLGFRKGLTGKWAGGKADEWGFRPDGGHRTTAATTFSAQKVLVNDLISVAKVSSLSLVKIDTDSVDDSLLQGFVEMIKSGTLAVDTFTVEEPSAATSWELHNDLGYTAYITVNPDTRFKPRSEWTTAGIVKRLTNVQAGSGGQTFQLSLIQIEAQSLEQWSDICRAARVLNMILTLRPEVIGQ